MGTTATFVEEMKPFVYPTFDVSWTEKLLLVLCPDSPYFEFTHWNGLSSILVLRVWKYTSFHGILNFCCRCFYIIA